MGDKLKAYRIDSDYSEASVIVFASRPSKAKGHAIGTDWLSDIDWRDLSCRRMPEADKYIGGYAPRVVIDGDNIDGARIMRELGWYEVDGNDEPCEGCELYEWYQIPESKLIEIAGQMLCASCSSPVVK